MAKILIYFTKAPKKLFPGAIIMENICRKHPQIPRNGGLNLYMHQNCNINAK